jgi:hypothetical protein
MQFPSEGTSKRNLSPWQDKLYWLIPLALAALQLIYIIVSRNYIRDEELAESVRNVFWLDHRLVYDGVSSNVGYYGLLLFVYKVFGFSLHSAKYVRLILYAAAMYSLAALLQKFVTKVHATVILVTIGLSPTILFFNTIQTSYGMDILYGIICLLIILSLHFDGSPKDRSLVFLLGLIAMLAAMSYPSFLLYIPSLGFLYLWHWRRRGDSKTTREFLINTACEAVGLIIPFLIAVYYLKNARDFLNDPVTQGGLFRGGGKLQLDIQVLKMSIQQTLSDIFQEGTSYYYYLPWPDFSGPIAWIGVAGAFLFGVFIAVKAPSFRPIFLLAGFHILLGLVAPGFALYPGIRRSTGFLAGMYAWYAIVLCGLCTQSSLRKIKRTGLLICFLLTANNLVHYPRNIEAVGGRSIWDDVTWFSIENTAEQSLQRWLEITGKGDALVCFHNVKTNVRVPCDYAKIYAAIAGYRRWNGLPETPVRAYDWNTREERVLSTTLWETYYFAH